ncbi:capsular biosynthesis protein [Clostridium tyrobutyricum]|uniref:Tyrosine-protein kinase transmembrane modulator EpsC n=1 Tax=Clostridium tyrobutyricum DIVETGP TaxID=1408889 RepID=W6N7B1_CLOTY|nr:Wzz/FepE/Etk N-terminal domain-containing protein [Clostridium tyrobutyricum]AND83735.1 capsular polysaccharide biosynthesis protein [Clostridium tyrobutyricum]ANP68498.1 capsular biosynthesis protein [Clostridium tyrobutyricum]MBV4433791.1 capsular biosynthesis protein [Clostridium tyrobutyricum]QNB67157.1 capsular biosynthesis protein [Clostridium tyrobutyricum]CDL92170.1 Tyrosine-protein kinase transmembrane modulator EpsC [Clostridium tyrobutyricum DIVETGP]
MEDEEMTLDLQDFFYIIKKRLKLIVLITLACAVISGLLSVFLIKPTYEASSSIIVGKPTNNIKTDNNDVMMYQNLVKTYAQIAQSDSVARATLNKLNENITLDDFQKMVSVTPEQGTQILTIKADSKDPNEAAKVVDTMASSFINESKKVFPTGGDIQIMDRAQIPNKPVKPKKTLNVAIAFFLGLIVSVGISFLLEYQDNTIKTEDDIDRYLGLPVIGVIPKSGK